MTPGQEDVLDSLVTLGRADVAELADHTGRHITGVRVTVKRLAELGYAESTGRSKEPSRPGRAAEMYKATTDGVQALGLAS